MSVGKCVDLNAVVGCSKDALAVVDILRRFITVLHDCTLLPLEHEAQSVGEAIATECSAVERGMTTCLADASLEKFVNTVGVAKMLRETQVQWSNSKRESQAIMIKDSDAATGLRAALEMRQLVDEELEACATACALTIQQLPSAFLVDPPSSAGTTVPVAGADSGVTTMSVAALCPQLAYWTIHTVEVALIEMSQRLRSSTTQHAEKTTSTEEDKARDAEEDEVPSQTYFSQMRCGDLVVAIRQCQPENGLLPPSCASSARALLSIVQTLKALVAKLHLLTQDAVDLRRRNAKEGTEKQHELHEMAKWFTASAIASREWHRELSRREAAAHLLHQRIQTMKKELDLATDEEALQRSQFVNRFGAHLPRGWLPMVNEQADQYEIAAVRMSSVETPN